MKKKVNYELFGIAGFHRNGCLAVDVPGLGFSVASHLCFSRCQL